MKVFFEFIEDNYEKMKTLARNVHPENYEDVCHEMITNLLEMPDTKQQQLLETNSVIWYFLKMLTYCKSSTSGYQRKYNKLKKIIVEDINAIDTDEIDIEDVKDDNIYLTYVDCVEILKQYGTDLERLVFIMRFETKRGFKYISTITNVPSSSLILAYNRAKKTILKYGKQEESL